MSILNNASKSGNCASLSLESTCCDYYKAVKRFVGYHIDYEQVEDITQETFFRFVRAYPHLKNEEHIYAYLVRIATNVITDYQRAPRQRRDHCDIEGIGELCAPESDPFEFCDKDELTGSMRSTWLTLPPRHRRVIELLAEGYRPREIAARMGWSDRETWRAIKEARAAFKRRYRVYRKEYQEVA